MNNLDKKLKQKFKSMRKRSLFSLSTNALFGPKKTSPISQETHKYEPVIPVKRDRSKSLCATRDLQVRNDLNKQGLGEAIKVVSILARRKSVSTAL